MTCSTSVIMFSVHFFHYEVTKIVKIEAKSKTLFYVRVLESSVIMLGCTEIQWDSLVPTYFT